MSTIYGPVPSWRFGRSLGIDIVLPPKTCTLDCIYCQLGSTSTKAVDETKGNIPDEVRVKSDLEAYLENVNLQTVDAVTFSGSGEPTLNPHLGEIAKEVRKLIGNKLLVILTNATQLHKEKVRKRLVEFDMVVAKLDAGDEETFRRLNRPKSKSITLKKVINGIKKLKKEIDGQVALEVMLLRTSNNYVSNVFGRSLKSLIKTAKSLNPDLIQLDIPYRPPSESYVKTPSDSEFKYAVDQFLREFNPEKLWVYGIHDMRDKKVKWKSGGDLENRILTLLKRRPCTESDISNTLDIKKEKIQIILKSLVENDKIQKQESKDKIYYLVKE
ncbi:MAG: radical SAM protein [Candidatus Lokiarchaeota archaeon]|nr:radical SAM protein [Candidatus Lokiarchaeota archaeon]